MHVYVLLSVTMEPGPKVCYLCDLTAICKCVDCMAVEETSGVARGGAVPQIIQIIDLL
jgi:hypothetical protein